MERLANGLLSIGGAILGTSFLFSQCTFTVDAGQRGILNNKIGSGI
jgi:hypothetical protein